MIVCRGISCNPVRSFLDNGLGSIPGPFLLARLDSVACSGSVSSPDGIACSDGAARSDDSDSAARSGGAAPPDSAAYSDGAVRPDNAARSGGAASSDSVAGSYRWARTPDGSLIEQWEVRLVVTESGVEQP